jgi:GT2 family glycosyltransferase
LIHQKGISVIIPNYNGRLLLPDILPPLYQALSNIQLPYEVIISDDCSTDESVLFVQENFSTIILLQNKTNEGFSPTINKGIFVAKYNFLLLLNSDVKLSENYFGTILPYFDDDDTFGVMGRIIGWDNDNIQDGGKYPSFHGSKIKTSGNYIPIESNAGDRLYSMYLSGANAFVSREKIIALGGFDELFAPFYIEDVELSIRAWRLGWKCYYEHNAICRHKTSTTIKLKSSKNFVKKIYYRNKMILHALHLHGPKLLFWYLQLIPESLLYLVTGRFWFMTSLITFFKLHKEIKNSKNKFFQLSKNKKVVLELRSVVNKILFSLKNIEVKRF